MPIVPGQPSAPALAVLIACLDAGGLAVVPTDTVYGIAARAEDADAVAELYRRKHRDPSVPTAVLVADAAQAERWWAPASAGRQRLIARYWPGPLTIVDRRRTGIDWDLGGDPSSLGARCPDYPLVRALATEVGPLAVSSANRSGDAPIVSAEHAATSLGSDLLVIDAGPLSGVASAVVDLRDGFRLRRPGPLSEAELRAAWEPPTMSSTEGK